MQPYPGHLVEHVARADATVVTMRQFVRHLGFNLAIDADDPRVARVETTL